MARSFNGSTDKIAAGISSVLRPANISVALWAYPTALTNGKTLLGYDKGQGQAYNLSIGIITAGNIEFNTYDGASWFSASGLSSLLTANAWNHLVGTYNGTTLKLYVNGTQTGTTATPSSLNYTGPNGLFFGDYDNNGLGANFYSGRLADIGIWNTALTQGEISALARGVRCHVIRRPNLLAYWPLDGLVSPEVDLGGQKFNGTLTGTSAAAGPPIDLLTRMPPYHLDAVAAASGNFFMFNPPLRGFMRQHGGHFQG